jgi:hypothetical protein
VPEEKCILESLLLHLPTIEVVLVQLLYYFDWEFPIGISHENFDMTEAFCVTVKRKNELIVFSIPYNP